MSILESEQNKNMDHMLYMSKLEAIRSVSSFKPVSHPKFIIDNALSSEHDDDTSTTSYSCMQSDASVGSSSVPSLDSVSERSPSPVPSPVPSSSSLEELACNEESIPNELQFEGQIEPNKIVNDRYNRIEKTDNKILHCVGELKPSLEAKWNLRYKELLEFMRDHGHVNVPHSYPRNNQLARWVKRQRSQYKFLQDGKPSTMTQERIEILNSCGFVWNSQALTWSDRLDELKEFHREHGHCNVKSRGFGNLGEWVKGQRRQYKLYTKGKSSAMNANRIKELEKIGFIWEIRRR